MTQVLHVVNARSSHKRQECAVNPQGFGASCSRRWPALWKSRKSRPQGFGMGFIWIGTVFWKQITFDSSLVSSFHERCTHSGKSFYLYLSRLLISMLSYFCYLLTILKAERGAVEQVGCGTVGHSADLYFHCSTSALWNLKSVHFGAGSFLWQRASIRKTPRGLEK